MNPYHAIRKILFVILISLIFINESSAQSGWTWLNPKPQGNDINDVECIDSKVYCVGKKGVYTFSTNSGVDWITNYLDVNSDLTSVEFLNSQTGFITSNISKIYRTINGGYNWISMNIGESMIYKDIKFFDSNLGILIGEKEIYKTINGGLNWNLLTTYPHNYTLNKIAFSNDSTIYICGTKSPSGIGANTGVILKSSNRGESWLESNAGTVLFSIKFISNNNIICLGIGKVYKSTDNGLSWINKLNADGVYMYDVEFFDSSNGYLIGYNSGNVYFLKTINGGDNWGAGPSLPMSTSVTNHTIKKVNETIGYITGPKGLILKTTDIGVSWNRLTYGYNITGTFYNATFINESTGFVTGTGYRYPNEQNIGIIKTTNSGVSWETSPNTAGVGKIYMINQNTGFTAGEFGVLKTVNSGYNWNSVLSSFNIHLSSIWFQDINTGIATGEVGRIYRTANSGSTWETQIIDDSYYTDVFFLNNLTGFICGKDRGGAFLKTTNGGINWTSHTIVGGTNQFNAASIYFINENIGFITGDGGLYKTVDNGNIWFQIDFIYTEFDAQIKFYNNIGLLTGTSGTYYKSTDYGFSWNKYNTGTHHTINGISIVNDSTYVFVGDGFTVLKTSSGGNPVNIKKINPGIIISSYLLQNYPNPFNPVTKIQFEIPKQSNVSIIIYDVLGKEVARLLNNDIKQQGRYEIDFDASNFASGIYFYKMIAGDFVQTNKMVLLK
ncbi:MAG TPA: YCF48-related protein [Ignavibacteria bacterium]|nr:YCF48-related protein [Ignavibacteria bacterium]